MIAWLKKWWNTRVQGDLAAIATGLVTIDITGYHDDIVAFLHSERAYHGIRLGLALTIWVRAMQVRRQQP
jgi:hypothetical protein